MDLCPHDIPRDTCELVCLNCGHSCNQHPKLDYCNGGEDCDCLEFENDPGR